MGLVLMFLCGVANFAFHGAVIDSGHPLLARIAYRRRGLWPRLSLLLEFAVLLTAMLLVANGYGAWGWAYGFYTLGNAIAAWLIISRRL